MNKKAQIGMKEGILTIIVSGLLGIIGLMIFANVTNNVDTQFDRVTTVLSGESVTITSGAGQLAHGALTTEDFSTLQAFGNITSINNIGINITAAGVVATNYTDGTYIANYTYLSDSAAMVTKTTIDGTILDSMELGVIALIVLAAVIILGALFMLGR